MTDIRSFRNVDLPVLLDLWIQHWSAIGPPPQLSLAQFEQAVVSRTFFDPENLLVAESDGNVQAWMHFTLARRRESTAVITALCASPAAPTEAMGELLRVGEDRMRSQGVANVTAGVAQDDQFGYAGLEPIGHGVGVSLYDMQVSAALQQAGYTPGRKFVRMVVSSAGYRPPVSRDALQFRRSASIESSGQLPDDPRNASAMSHLDVESQQLRDGRSGEELAKVVCWLSDAEAEVMRPSCAIIDLAEIAQRGRLESAESYLIGALIQMLADRRIETIETVIDAEATELVSQLEKLSFNRADEGQRWEKSLG